MKHWKQRLHFYIATLAIMGVVSCTNEEVQIDSPTSPDVNTDKVKLTMKVSVPSSPGMTRAAMSTDTENALQEIKILAFKVDATNSVRTYAYTTDGKVSPDGEGGIKITAGVKRSSSDSDKYRFLLIANPNEALPNLTDKSRLKQVKGLITYDCSDKWNLERGIPMSGETPDVLISENTKFETIELTRAMARVDVGVNYTNKTSGSESVAGLDVFRLQSVSVYRSNSKGKVVAGQGPIGPQRGDNSPLTYTKPEGLGPNELWSSNRQIYLPESDAGSFDTATCLIIGGQYSNAATPDWSAVLPTYYRVDFIEGGSYLPIVRNHRYIVNITSVAGEGYATEQEALKNVPANISVQITDWNESSFGDVEISGNTHFACDTRIINLGYKANDSIAIKAESSVPVDKWIIEDDNAWNDKIKVDTVKTDLKKANIIFRASVNGDTYEADTLHVVMKVGYVTAKFKVVQDKGIFAQPDDIVVEGWSPSDKEEDILTDDPKK